LGLETGSRCTNQEDHQRQSAHPKVRGRQSAREIRKTGQTKGHPILQSMAETARDAKPEGRLQSKGSTVLPNGALSLGPDPRQQRESTEVKPADCPRATLLRSPHAEGGRGARKSPVLCVSSKLGVCSLLSQRQVYKVGGRTMWGRTPPSAPRGGSATLESCGYPESPPPGPVSPQCFPQVQGRWRTRLPLAAGLP